jgi:cytoskeletal protein CcmA (bactofilin family)
VDDRGVVRHDAIHAEQWGVDGTTKVLGAADAGSVVVRGTAVIGAGLSADACRAVGTLDVGGPIEVRSTLSVEGHFRVRGAVHAGDLEVRGSARLTGDARSDRSLTVRGSLSAPNLRATAIDLEGAAEVPGVVEAEAVEARFDQDSHLGRIQARQVRLRGHVPNVVDRAFFRHANVSIERIDADHVELEAVTVLFVRAPEIVVGRDASVAEVDGKIVRRHPSSHIGPESKSPRPYGLRR